MSYPRLKCLISRIIRTNKKYKVINLKARVQTYIGLAGLARDLLFDPREPFIVLTCELSDFRMTLK